MKKILLIFLIFLLSPCSSFGIEEGFLEEITLEENLLKENMVFKLNPYEAKKIIFKNSIINEVSPVLNFRGVYEADISDDRHNFTYPFIIEGGAELKFGESKNKIRAVSNFTRDVDDLDNKFLGKISDIYFERKINENHKILIGNARVPFGFEGSKSTYNLMFSKRAQIGENFNDARALGVKYTGSFDGFEYSIGGYSATRYLQDITDGAEFAGWINYKPFYKNSHIFKDLKIGAGGDIGVLDKGYGVYGAGMEWEYKKFLLNAEYAYADGSNALNYNPDKQEGFYTTAAYNLTDKLQFAFRYDIFDSNTKKSNDTVQKYTAGLNYYLFGRRLKFGLDYTYTQVPAANDINSVHFLTQVML